MKMTGKLFGKRYKMQMWGTAGKDERNARFSACKI